MALSTRTDGSRRLCPAGTGRGWTRWSGRQVAQPASRRVRCSRMSRPRRSSWALPTSRALGAGGSATISLPGAGPATPASGSAAVSGSATRVGCLLGRRVGFGPTGLGLGRLAVRLGLAGVPSSGPGRPGGPAPCPGGNRVRKMSGSRYMTRAVGTARRTLVSTRFTVSTASETDSRDQLDLGPHQQLVGSDVLGAHVDQALHAGLDLDGRRDLLLVGDAGRLADEQALHLDRQHDGDADQQQADRHADRSTRGSPVMCETVTAVRAMTRPTRPPGPPAGPRGAPAAWSGG